MERTVTIAIPFAGEAPHLIESVNSVIAQTSDNWKLVLVSDGAAPTAVAAARKVLRDPRVRLVEEPDTLGLATRLNQIAAACETEYLMRMDSDDVMHPERIDTQLRILVGGSMDILGSRAYVIDNESRVRGGYSEPELPTTARGFLRSNAVSHPTVVGRSAWFRANPYDPKMLRCEDMELWARTYQHTIFGKTDTRLLFYRIGQDLSYSKHALSARYYRHVLRLYGSVEAGRVRSTTWIASSVAKQIAFATCCGFNQKDRIYARRISALDRSEISQAQKVCDQARRSRPEGGGL